MAIIPKIKETEVYGYWTVSKVVSCSHIECECKCGLQKVHRQTDLLRGVTTKCPNCHLKRQPEHIKLNSQFGDWTVINIEDYQHQLSSGKKIERKWHCRCKCGKEKWIRTSHLSGGLTKSCPNCANINKRNDKVGDIPLGDIHRYQYSAKARKIEWSIENEALWLPFQRQEGRCALSGVEIQFSDLGMGRPGSKYTSTASLDRRDSSKGYIIDNVQWVHKDTNRMKLDFIQEDFIQWCKLITEHNKK